MKVLSFHARATINELHGNIDAKQISYNINNILKARGM
jgi:hypothetical protein